MPAAVRGAEATWDDMTARACQGYRYVGRVNLQAPASGGGSEPISTTAMKKLKVSADDDLAVAVSLDGNLYVQAKQPTSTSWEPTLAVRLGLLGCMVAW
jgi:hypothetical protein